MNIRYTLAWFLCLATTTVADGPWKKHTITQQGHCNTAVALKANDGDASDGDASDGDASDGNGRLDVIASMNGKVSLFVAPEWNEVVLHRFPTRGSCIHSEVIDADGDGDMDWVGTLSNAHPFWLENPGTDNSTKGAWTSRSIDDEITGIHCILRSDVNNDGRDDLIINNFEPKKGIGDSMAWFSIPAKPRKAERWIRHVFANGDARGGSHYMGADDIDGDGWKEIAVGAKGKPFVDGNWFAFWKNPGPDNVNGAWEKVILAENQTAATNILPADVNGDGKTDWLASRGHGKGVIWFENPTWTIHDVDTEIKFPHSLTVADHDQDGDLDAATCGYGSERVMWYENDGRGNFTLHTLDEDQQSYDLRSIDMDGDGDQDLLNAGRGSNNVVWYENPLQTE